MTLDIDDWPPDGWLPANCRESGQTGSVLRPDLPPPGPTPRRDRIVLARYRRRIRPVPARATGHWSDAMRDQYTGDVYLPFAEDLNRSLAQAAIAQRWFGTNPAARQA